MKEVLFCVLALGLLLVAGCSEGISSNEEKTDNRSGYIDYNEPFENQTYGIGGVQVNLSEKNK